MSSHGAVYLREDQWRIELDVGAMQTMLFDKIDIVNGDVKVTRLHNSNDSSVIASLMVKARHMPGLITAQPLTPDAEPVGDAFKFEGEMRVELHTDSNKAGPQFVSVSIDNAKTGT